MLREITLKVDDIVKIRTFENATVFYTTDKYYVCIKEQELPTRSDMFVTLKLKDGDKPNG